jgi:hypothetical protein
LLSDKEFIPFWENTGSASWIFKTSIESIVEVFNGLSSKKASSLVGINLDAVKQQGYVLDADQARTYLFQSGYLTVVKWEGKNMPHSLVQLESPNGFCGEFLLKCLYLKDKASTEVPIFKVTKALLNNPCFETTKN